jgi:hypothetical protein
MSGRTTVRGPAYRSALFNHLMYGLNHNIRPVILDVVPTPLRDDPCFAS